MARWSCVICYSSNAVHNIGKRFSTDMAIHYLGHHYYHLSLRDISSSGSSFSKMTNGSLITTHCALSFPKSNDV